MEQSAVFDVEPPRKIALRVVHHARFDPRGRVGGVHSFALGLREIFEEVEYTSSNSCSLMSYVDAGVPVICDNHTVRDWPTTYPVIGFRHGVAARKVAVTRSSVDARLAWGQWRAARRPNVVWAACAQWIAAESQRLYKSPTHHIIYHPIDIARFDGKLDNRDSRLILHDARGNHKGQRLIPVLQRAFPEWRFEALGCPPSQVSERMRSAAAFVHLSRYEGNSIVCNEAMAMNLPCLFTAVGLMLDKDNPLDVWRIDPRMAYGDSNYLIAQMRQFLDTLPSRCWRPREWVERHATLGQARRGWRAVIAHWTELHGGARAPQ